MLLMLSPRSTRSKAIVLATFDTPCIFGCEDDEDVTEEMQALGEKKEGTAQRQQGILY